MTRLDGCPAPAVFIASWSILLKRRLWQQKSRLVRYTAWDPTTKMYRRLTRIVRPFDYEELYDD